jgi:hypothetical protein
MIALNEQELTMLETLVYERGLCVPGESLNAEPGPKATPPLAHAFGRLAPQHAEKDHDGECKRNRNGYFPARQYSSIQGSERQPQGHLQLPVRHRSTPDHARCRGSDGRAGESELRVIE